MKYLLLTLVVILSFSLTTPATAGLLREIVDNHQASHGEGNMTRAQWKSYIKTVDGRVIDQSRPEKIVVYDVSCDEDKCSVSGYPYPQGNDFLPRVTWKWINQEYGIRLSRGDVISIYGIIDILDFLTFNITVK